MSANPNRRSLLALTSAAPVAAAGMAAPSRASSTGIAGWMRGAFLDSSGLSYLPGEADQALLPPFDLPPPFETFELSSIDPQVMAATALVFPPEIEAYRSFAPNLKRRLYRELLEREAARQSDSDFRTSAPTRTGA